ncbi:dentin sialophosphoprotein-like isoform X2 [Planococcus citri]|uniref:dentin sialophosphoprotein-like isoform X2 n=1 Tax=Planococcus citri TaxID=170843 RepID=UPI0031F8C4A3
MIEMSHTDEDLKDAGLFAGEDDKLPANDVSEKCHTALEILQNELMNCERDISLEKSVREQNERKFQCFGESKDISSEVMDNVPNEKFVRLDDTVVSGKNDIFSNDQYCELIEKVTRISNQCNGIEEDAVQKIIFEYAELNNINHGFDRTSRKTGDEWYQRFIRSYPQLNSVVKKPCNDTIQLGGTDTEQTNEIVDAFISDFKKSKEDATNYQSMELEELENEKHSRVASEKDSTKLETSPCLNSSEGVVSVCLFNDADIFNQNDSNHVLSENSSLAEPVDGNNEVTTESKQTYSNDLGENASFGLIETPQSVENCGNEEFIGTVSSVNSNNSHLVNDYSGNDQNISNESDRELNGTSENVAEMRNDDSYGVVVDEANTSFREISLCLETPDIECTEKASGSEIEMKNDDITAVADNACIESNDGKTPNGEDVTVSGKSTSDLKDDVTGNLQVPYPQNENMANNSIPPSVSTDAVADETPPSVRSPSKRKDTDSPAGPEGQEEAKKPKIGKKRGPLSKRKKRAKYLYKLKSYNGNSDDTITTLPNEDAPLEMNHIDDTEMLNADDDVTDQMETEMTNHTDEKEMLGANDGIKDQVETETTNHTDEKEKLNADDDSNDQVETETTNCTDGKERLNADDDLKDQIETETTNSTDENVILNTGDDLKDQIETETKNSTDENVILNTGDDLEDQIETETTNSTDENVILNTGDGLKDQVETETTNQTDEIEMLNAADDSEDPVETETNSISHDDELKSQVEEDTNSCANVEFEHQGETESNSSAEFELKDPVEVETNPCADVEMTKPVETDANSCTDVDMKDQDETETNFDADVQMEDQDQAETNSCFDVETKDEDQTETNSCGDLPSTERILTETNPCADVELKKEFETETSSSADAGLKDQVETEINSRADADSNDHIEMETSSNFDNDLKNQDEAESNLSSTGPLEQQIKTETHSSLNDDESKDPVIAKTDLSASNESNDQVVDDTNSNNDNESNKEVANSTEMTKEKNTSKRTNNEGATPRTKMNTSNEKITPTFSMQTRRKRLKFLPDGTLVTPNQRHPHFSEEYSSSSRSEPKSSRKRPLKSSPQDTPRPEKKMKMASTPSPATPKQPNRPTVTVKKEPKSRPDRYIPKPNGQSKKPQKLFDYDSFYRENFRQTEVQLPSSCKKQMVALSKVTSISPGAQGGGQITVNPSQLLSCLLGMPITPDQIRTVRFKPPGKQLKLNKPSNITPSKSAIDDSTKPLAKRHSELLQKIPKTETGVAKSAGNTKVHQTT